MAICIKTGGRVWIEEANAIYSADIHKLNDTYIIYCAPSPLTSEVYDWLEAQNRGAKYGAVEGDGHLASQQAFYREQKDAYGVWVGPQSQLLRT